MLYIPPDQIRDRIAGTVAALFSHGPRPLEHTLHHINDPGLLGPKSVSWRVIGDTSVLLGGIRALVLQTAHPDVAAGVGDHSVYRADPLGRLTRTSFYVTQTTYGSLPEVDDAIRMVRRAHVGVQGVSERGNAYSADAPALAAWVHNCLTDSFLVAHQTYGTSPLTPAEADQFVAEQARIGRLLDADPLPETAAELSAWISEHPDLGACQAQRDAMNFLSSPPLAPHVKAGYQLLYHAAAVTVPDHIASLIGANPSPFRARMGRKMLDTLRWALGFSPAWHVSLIRAGADVPERRFRQPLDYDDPHGLLKN